MSISSQSQEAIAAIDAELELILHKKKKESKGVEEDSDDDSAHTESEIDDEESQSPPKKVKKPKKKTPKKAPAKANSPNSPRKRTRGDDEAERLGAKYTAKQTKKNEISTSSSEPTSDDQPPTLQRIRSLEAINKHQPLQIVRVCLEKAKLAVQEDPKDYKKVKYYLKIALSVSKTVDRLAEFNDSIKGLKSAYSWDTELKEMLDTNFPEE